MSADTKLKAYIDRVLRLKEEQDTLGDDIREVYAEAKGEGYDKTIMGKLVAHLRKVAKSGADAVDEAESIFETYLSAYHRASGTPVATHTHEEEFDPITGEFLDDGDANPRLIKQVVDGIQSEAGKAALLTVINIMIDREEAEEITSSGGSSSAPSSLTTREAEESVVPHSPGTANEREAVATICEATVSTQPKDVSLPADGESSEGASAGGNDVDRSGSPATHLVTGEGTALSALPDNSGVVMEDVPEMPMKRPAFISCFPELPNAEYARLRGDIVIDGICEPIIRQGDVIVDGWERFLISRELGFDYPIIAYTGTDVLLDVIELQRASRNFTTAQEKKIAADLAKEFPQRADEIMAAFGLVEALEVAQ